MSYGSYQVKDFQGRERTVFLTSNNKLKSKQRLLRVIRAIRKPKWTSKPVIWDLRYLGWISVHVTATSWQSSLPHSGFQKATPLDFVLILERYFHRVQNSKSTVVFLNHMEDIYGFRASIFGVWKSGVSLIATIGGDLSFISVYF